MGGRGTFAAGKKAAYSYKTVGMIDGVKILQPMDDRKSPKLPEESHTAGNRYVLLNKKGVFISIGSIIRIIKWFWKSAIILKADSEKVKYCIYIFTIEPELNFMIKTQRKSEC